MKTFALMVAEAELDAMVSPNIANTGCCVTLALDVVEDATEAKYAAPAVGTRFTPVSCEVFVWKHRLVDRYP
jgi:hypothetical protein